MILLLDNYDSFTWNLVQALGALGREVHVVQSDAVTLAQIESWAPTAIVLSPGPGRPRDAGICLEVVHHFGARVPLLGVCLGHQVLCEALGAKVTFAARLFHGRTSEIEHDGSGIFAGLPRTFRVARYHSLVVDPRTLPGDLIATSFADSGELMSVRHARWPAQGVQFHPESFLTEYGSRLLSTFVSFAEAHRATPHAGLEVSVG